MSRHKLFMAIVIAATAAALAGGPSRVARADEAAGRPAARPNFLVILADDLGWGDLGCYGHPNIRTPNLDRLAAQGVRLTSCYSAAPVCSPARVGLLTGSDPNRLGVYDWIPSADQPAARVAARHQVHLLRGQATLPQLLRDAGYATILSGKWHCNSHFNDPRQPQPDDAGFDHWFATQNNAAPSHANPVNYVRNGRAVGELEGYSCQLAASEVIRWLERRHEQSPGQPFFAYVAFHEPHEPIASPPRLVEKYLEVADSPQQAEYFANVENLDAAVGSLLDALERLGVAERTFVVFTSDNGPETLNRYRGAERSHGSPGPLRGMKLWTTDGGIRVPGILRWPDRVAPGQVIDDPVSSLDLLPTFCSLAGVPLPAEGKFDGVNFEPLMRGQPLERPRPLFWVYFNALNEERVAMRDGPWKLLARLDAGRLPTLTNVTTDTAARVRDAQLTDFRLYRLDTDIGESEDQAAAEPQQLAAMASRMRSLYAELAATMHVWVEEQGGRGSSDR